MNKYIIHLYVVEFYDPNSAVTLESFVHDFNRRVSRHGCRPLQTTPRSKFKQDKNSPALVS